MPTQINALREYAGRQSDGFIIHALIFLVFTGILFWARKSLRPMVKEEPGTRNCFFRLSSASCRSFDSFNNAEQLVLSASPTDAFRNTRCGGIDSRYYLFTPNFGKTAFSGSQRFGDFLFYRPTPANYRYTAVAFADFIFGGNVGCNNFSGLVSAFKKAFKENRS